MPKISKLSLLGFLNSRVAGAFVLAATALTAPSCTTINKLIGAAPKVGISTFSTKAGMKSRDPRKLFFLTPGVTSAQQFGRGHQEQGALKMFPNTTVIYTPEHQAQEYILSAINEQVKQYGTLTEIVINAHGSPFFQYASFLSQKQDTKINLGDLLKKIEDLQKKSGTKITNRIVFDGCNTMSDLTPEGVDYYRNMSRSLNTEIVGTTDTAWDAGTGNYARFNPDGSILRDAISADQSDLDNLVKSYEMERFFGLRGEPLPDYTSPWFPAFLNKSAADGKATFENNINRSVLSYEKQEASLPTHKANSQSLPKSLLLSSIGIGGWQNVIDRSKAIAPWEPVKLSYARALTGEPKLIQKAVAAHEEFIRQLSPQTQQKLANEVKKYEPGTSLASADDSDNLHDYYCTREIALVGSTKPKIDKITALLEKGHIIDSKILPRQDEEKACLVASAKLPKSALDAISHSNDRYFVMKVQFINLLEDTHLTTSGLFTVTPDRRPSASVGYQISTHPLTVNGP